MDTNPITEYVTCAPLVDDLSCFDHAAFSARGRNFYSGQGSMNARNSILSRVSVFAFWQYERTQQHPFTGLAFWCACGGLSVRPIVDNNHILKIIRCLKIGKRRAPFRWVSGHLLRLHFFQFYGTRYITHVHIKKAASDFVPAPAQIHHNLPIQSPRQMIADTRR
ncbi:hypothetical protein C8J55DRAFT_494322 [Lentinula edodes]|uniref:Uncharacterized protein n=1 Tax=Lentinula lateritia TaxID=40482 RepID=A0A9W9DDF1_9AGAR|nr:hypothetical protein C8J55DRAFT_494322 [Lentinula edodes]